MPADHQRQRIGYIIPAMSRLFTLLLVLAAAAHAQVSTATLTGIVTDQSQASLPNVTLRLTGEETGVTTTVQSNAQGEYTFPLLTPGRYRLVTEAAGFQSSTRTGIVLELGRVTRLDITLALGQVNESVNVTGTAPLLESESSTVGQFIENKSIVDMPLNGRRVGQLMAMMGHAVFITGDVIRPRYAIAGSRSDSQQWLIDGVNASNIALEVSQALFNPPVEAVQEIRVQQSAYSAEFGNSAAGVIAMTTRSGTNDFHGLAYEYFRNDKLDAKNFFALSKPSLRWNVFGGALGGPVVRNKTFFFAHVEFQKQRVGNVRTFTVPTAGQVRGDFSQTRTAAGAIIPIFDPFSNHANPANASQTIRDQFPNNVIPQNRLDPVGASIAALFPAPNRAAANAAGASNWSGNNTNALDITTATAKVDHHFSDRDRFSFRYIIHDFPTFNTAAFATSAADPNANSSDRRAFSYLFNELHNFSPTIINDFRFNWQPRRFHNASEGLGEGWPSKLGLKGVDDRAFPRVNVAGFTSLGNTTHDRIQIPIHDTHLVDAVSIFRGAHSHRFGGEVRLARNVDNFYQLVSGQLGFAVQGTAQPGINNTGSAFASLLLGFVSSGDIRATDELDRRSKYVALFWQDDWKATRNLTLNIGLRWEAHTPRFDVRDRINGFDATKINPVSGTPGIVTFANRDGYSRSLYNGDYNNFMPRFGFAWRPFGLSHTVVRSGYGIFFGPPLPGSNNTSAGFEVSGSFTSPDNGLTAPFLLRNGFPDTKRATLGPGFGAVPVGQAVTFAPEFNAVDRRIGYSQQWNLTVQHEIGWLTVLELSYVGNVGHKLPGPSTNINQVPPALMGAGNAQVRRPFPQFGNVTSNTPFWGNSSYHGLNVKLEKRFSGGLNFLLSYTVAKFIDDVTSGQELGTVGGGIQNIYDRRAEKSLSGNDVRNRLAFSESYELPWGKGRRWLTGGPLSQVLGGWGLATILTLQDGSPDGFVTQNNSTNAFGGAQRVNVLRDPSLPKSARSIGRYFDATAVAAPPQFTFGNAGRALITGPGIANFDIALLKNHRFGERYNIQFRLESFNAFNRVNLEDPGRSLGAANFGVISDSRNAQSAVGAEGGVLISDCVYACYSPWPSGRFPEAAPAAPESGCS